MEEPSGWSASAVRVSTMTEANGSTLMAQDSGALFADYVSRFKDVPIKEPKPPRTECCGRPVKPKKDAKEELPSIPLSKMLGRLDRKYKCLMAWGTIFALLQGVALPVFAIAFGELFGVFFETTEPDLILERARIIAGVFMGLAVWNLVMGTLGQFMWATVGQHLGLFLRMEFFSSLVRQDVGYLDENTSGKLVAMLNADIEAVRNACSEKASTFFAFIGQAVAGVIIAFVYSPALTGVLLGISPLMAVGGMLQQLVVIKGAQSQSHLYGEASSFAGEIIKGYRMVAAYVWQGEALKRYTDKLKAVKGPRLWSAFFFGLQFLLMFSVFAIAMMIGAIFLTKGILTVDELLVSFFAVLTGALGLGQAATFLPDFAKGRSAAASIVQVLKREPIVDPNVDGVQTGPLVPRIEFRDVEFSFPNRDQAVLKNVSFVLEPGQTIGLCGASGAGKSTLVKLLERFYDVTAGEIRIGEHNLKDYNLHWLRGQIAIVSQEPTLFNTSIKDNILIGRRDATDEEVEAAARAANAHDFIAAFPEGYATVVGEGGGQMSGGQRQRICIARAILKDPAILILDEATASLDNKSEAVVQEALDRASEGRTTVAIAHRLSTIKNSDVLLVMDEGHVVESGKHWELMRERGLYYMLQVQQMSPEELADLELSMKQ